MKLQILLFQICSTRWMRKYTLLERQHQPALRTPALHTPAISTALFPSPNPLAVVRFLVFYRFSKVQMIWLLPKIMFVQISMNQYVVFHENYEEAFKIFEFENRLYKLPWTAASEKWPRSASGWCQSWRSGCWAGKCKTNCLAVCFGQSYGLSIVIWKSRTQSSLNWRRQKWEHAKSRHSLGVRFYRNHIIFCNHDS